jgi:Fe-S-cluster containining protein
MKKALNVAMPGVTNIALTDSLPLTCSRDGACCHGKMVCLNPWELACLAAAKDLTSAVFRDRYCEFGGIRLRFDITADSATVWKELPECSLYVPDCGCSVYGSRPLVCRLYPFGRLRSGNELHYIHQGSSFPCMVSCPAVLDLPYKTVADYLAGQEVMAGETAQDNYLEIMQQLADYAFILLLESGLAASGDQLTLRLWRKLGKNNPEHSAEFIGPEWINRLMLPDIGDLLTDPAAFARRHSEMLESQIQASFSNLGDLAALREASGLMMGLALHLGRGLGANPAVLAEHWITTAKELGAGE